MSYDLSPLDQVGSLKKKKFSLGIIDGSSWQEEQKPFSKQTCRSQHLQKNGSRLPGRNKRPARLISLPNMVSEGKVDEGPRCPAWAWKAFHFAVWTGSACYASWCFSVQTQDHPSRDRWSFENGMYGLARKRDATDNEWNRAVAAFVSHYPWLVVQVLVSQIAMRAGCKQILPQFYAIYSTAFLVYVCGWVATAIFYVLYAISYLAALSQSLLLCYLLPAAVFGYVQFNLMPPFVQHALFDQGGPIMGYMVNIGLGWTCTRALSFAVDCARRKSRPPPWTTLAYMLYLPCIFVGPLTNYVTFEKEMNRPPSPWTLSWGTLCAFVNLGRCLLLYFFYNLLTHFFYHGAVSYSLNVVESLDSWCIAGFSFVTIFAFYLKYRVLYGTSVAVAGLEGVWLPPAPTCIARVHLCSYLWKYFDRGLHLWLVRYIYFPVLGEKRRFFTAVLGAAGCFLFVWVWHGMSTAITTWCTLNFLGIFAEQIAAQIRTTAAYASFEKNHPDQLWVLRATLCSLSVILSGISCMFFLTGQEVSETVARRLLLGFPLPVVPLLFAFYCGSHVGLDVFDAEKTRRRAEQTQDDAGEKKDR